RHPLSSPTRRSSDLLPHLAAATLGHPANQDERVVPPQALKGRLVHLARRGGHRGDTPFRQSGNMPGGAQVGVAIAGGINLPTARSEEHTSELQSREN